MCDDRWRDEAREKMTIVVSWLFLVVKEYDCPLKKH
jgi:hypothetical protein